MTDHMATLTMTYRDGLPVLTVGEGDALPGGIAVENADGKIVAIYRAETQATTLTRSFPPVYQLSTLREPVRFSSGEPEDQGVLEGFTLVVDQSSGPHS